jgi:hypothetical protein
MFLALRGETKMNLRSRIERMERRLKPPQLASMMEAFLGASATPERTFVPAPLAADDPRLQHGANEEGKAARARTTHPRSRRSDRGAYAAKRTGVSTAGQWPLHETKRLRPGVNRRRCVSRDPLHSERSRHLFLLGRNRTRSVQRPAPSRYRVASCKI